MSNIICNIPLTNFQGKELPFSPELTREIITSKTKQVKLNIINGFFCLGDCVDANTKSF